jgi:hypothetical protein
MMTDEIGFDTRINHPYYSATFRISNPQFILGVGPFSENAEIKSVPKETIDLLERVAEALTTA